MLGIGPACDANDANDACDGNDGNKLALHRPHVWGDSVGLVFELECFKYVLQIC